MEIAEWGHPPHRHEEAQILYAVTGACVVTTPQRSLRVDTETAVWIPAGLDHAARFDPEFMPVVVCLEPGELVDGAPLAEARAVRVAPEQRRALLGFAREGDAVRSVALARSIAEALCGQAERPAVPRPSGPFAAPVLAALQEDPSHCDTLDEWAARLHCSVTSIRRAFVAETGMSFTEWRSRFRVEASLEALERGGGVAAVAARVGMTHNGYSLAFRRMLGCTPSEYRAHALRGSREDAAVCA